MRLPQKWNEKAMPAIPVSSPLATSQEVGGETQNYRIVALVVSISLFMFYLDSTILITALPVVARDFGIEPIKANVVILVYQIVLAVFIPVGSALGARWGERRIYMGALVLFLCGSVLGSLSTSLLMLVVARLVQGLAGAAMLPTGRLIVVRATEPSHLVSAMNWLMVPAIIGPLMGPPLGGLIATYGSWHYIFLINCPVAILGLVLVLRFVTADQGGSAQRFDTKGLFLAGPALGLMVFGLEMLANADDLGGAALMLLGGLAAGLGYVAHARHTEAPLIELSLLQIESFRFSMAIGTVMRTISTGAGFLLPLWFQLALGMSAARSGAISFAVIAGALVSRFVGQWMVRQFAMRTIMLVSTLSSTILLLLCARLSATTPLPVFYVALGGFGLMSSIPVMLATANAYIDIPSRRMGAATGFYTTVQQLCGSFGVTLTVAGTNLTEMLTVSTVTDSITYAGGLICLAVVCGGSVILACRIRPDAGMSLRC